MRIPVQIAFLRRLVFGLVLLVPLAASAQATPTDDELARNYFNLGTAQLDRGDYEDAVRSFEASYRYSGRPGLLYNLYLAHERLGQLEQAADYLGRYLASGEAIENRTALEARRESLLRRIEARRNGTPEPAPPPEAEPAQVATSSAPENAGPAIDANATSTPPATTPRRVAPIVLYASSAAMATSFGVAALMARAEDRRLHTLCDGTSYACSSSDVAGLRRRDLAADLSLGLAGGLLVSAIVVQLVHRDESPEVFVMPRVDARYAGLTFAGRFP